jgi:hypothetical protein
MVYKCQVGKHKTASAWHSLQHTGKQTQQLQQRSQEQQQQSEEQEQQRYTGTTFFQTAWLSLDYLALRSQNCPTDTCRHERSLEAAAAAATTLNHPDPSS